MRHSIESVTFSTKRLLAEFGKKDQHRLRLADIPLRRQRVAFPPKPNDPVAPSRNFIVVENLIHRALERRQIRHECALARISWRYPRRVGELSEEQCRLVEQIIDAMFSDLLPAVIEAAVVSLASNDLKNPILRISGPAILDRFVAHVGIVVLEV